jgi:hypothetical protein
MRPLQEKDRKKAEELSQKPNLGPEYLALVESLRDNHEIVSTFDRLDESCPH